MVLTIVIGCTEIDTLVIVAVAEIVSTAVTLMSDIAVSVRVMYSFSVVEIVT